MIAFSIHKASQKVGFSYLLLKYTLATNQPEAPAEEEASYLILNTSTPVPSLSWQILRVSVYKKTAPKDVFLTEAGLFVVESQRSLALLVRPRGPDPLATRLNSPLRALQTTANNTKNASFCQDRLGTNIGKALKKRRVQLM
eukprot:COSAG06_NODE_2368_length_6998_cov_3.945934_8_plen_142_part_00